MSNRTGLTNNDYDTLRHILQREYGVDIMSAGDEVISEKLERYRERRALSSVTECLDDILRDATRAQALGDIIYSQSTYFNRSPHHFDLLVDSVLREHKERLSSPGQELSLWSLGCSTGQEAYTIAIYLMEWVFPQYGAAAPFHIVAADCTANALGRTAAGRYALGDVKRFDTLDYHKYFAADGEGHLVVREAVRKHVEVRRFNLITSEYVFERRADYVFMRNAINFHTSQAKRIVLNNLHRLLTANGYLILADVPGMEPADIVELGYREVARGCYQRR